MSENESPVTLISPKRVGVESEESQGINRPAEFEESYVNNPLLPENEQEKNTRQNEDHLFVEKPKAEKSWRETQMKWLALSLACGMLLGSYMSFDYPSYLQPQILRVMFGYDGEDDQSDIANKAIAKYNWLYSIYSLPNFILPLFGGLLIDKIGIRTGNFIFTSILFVGQMVCMLSGLFAGGTVISKWFYGRQLALALGTTVSSARLGSVLGGWLLPALFSVNNNLALPLFFADMFCLFGIVSALSLNYMDKKADEQEGKSEITEVDETEQVKLSDIRFFPLLFWLISISCIMNYICMFVFIQNAGGLLTYRYQVPEEDIGKFISIPYFMSMGITPFMGILVDRIGNRQWLLLGATSIMVIAHVMFLTFHQCPTGPVCSPAYYVVPLVLMGIFYSCYAAVLWPCIPMVVNQKTVGTAFGVATSLQNFGLFVSPLLVSQIFGHTKYFRGGYGYISVFFVSCGAFCILVNIAIIIVNKQMGNILGKVVKIETNKSIAKRSSIMIKN